MMKRLTVILFVWIFAIHVAPSEAQSIAWKSLSKAQELAAQDGKKVMIFAEAKWCSYCKKMYRQVFSQSSVQDSLQKYFHPVRIDIESKKNVQLDGKTYTEKQLAREFRVSGTPTIIFLDSQGGIIGSQPGFLPAHIFDKLLAFVGRGLTGTMSFEKYLNDHGVTVDQ